MVIQQKEPWLIMVQKGAWHPQFSDISYEHHYIIKDGTYKMFKSGLDESFRHKLKI